jgi:hypothetical protein
VVDLHHIPHSCVVSSGNEWAAESWSVPIFILSQKLLGGLPADEDIPPADGSTPHPMPQVPFAPADEAPAAPDQAQQAPHGWPLWLHGQIQAQNLAPANVNIAGQNLGFIDNMIHGPPDLNVIPHNIPIDLNAQPHQLDEEDFLELNDLINPVDHLPGEDVVFALAASNTNVQPPNANVQPPADVDMDQPEEMLSDLTITISSANTLSDESGDSVNGAAQHQQLHIGLALVPEVLVDPVQTFPLAMDLNKLLSSILEKVQLLGPHTSSLMVLWLIQSRFLLSGQISLLPSS